MNRPRVQTYGMPYSYDRLHPSTQVPTSWLPSVQPVSVIGVFMLTALAHLHDTR